jgi:hypothetical protein
MKLSELQKIANKKGLSISRYNPGDNLTYKVHKGENINYFADKGLIRCKKLKQVMEFLLTYEEGNDNE